MSGGGPDSDFESQAYGVSADGSVVGEHGNSSFAIETFLWDEHNGMRALEDVLVNDSGLGRVRHERAHVPSVFGERGFGAPREPLVWIHE
jgi:hypothetical protein